MQPIQDVCLGTLLADYILVKPAIRGVSFDIGKLNHHGLVFHPQYNKLDASVLLQLSLMVTNANFDNAPLRLNVAGYLDQTIDYSACPAEIINKGLSTSSQNCPSNLVHVLANLATRTVIIIFSGTSNLCLAAADAEYHQVPVTQLKNVNSASGLRAHRGILNTYLAIRGQLLHILKSLYTQMGARPGGSILNTMNSPAKVNLVITGHSLGGALATLAGLDLAHYDPLVYSFASPLIFNPPGVDIYAHYVPRGYRIANLSDMITMLPLPIMPNRDVFVHVGIPVLFQLNLNDAGINHSYTYIREYDVGLRYNGAGYAPESPFGKLLSIFR